MVWIWPIQKYIVKREIPLSKRIGLKICMQSEKKNILKWQDDKNIQCQYINFCPNMQNL